MDNYLIGEFLLIIGFIISLAAQIYVNVSYRKYKNIENSKGLTGFDVARKILDENGLKDIYVTEVRGNLTDHYDPVRKVIRLSTDIFHGKTIASSSVAAHEVGHAIQDKEGYSFMRFRSMMFPLVRFSSYGGYIAILVGALFGLMDLIWFGIGLEIVILLFQIITLPVEVNASRRALKELDYAHFFTSKELDDGKVMLTAAALTYVASILTTLLELLRLIMIFGRRDD